MPQHYGGLLSQIGRGLQLGAGVMNPEIFAQQQQERAQAKALGEQRKQALAQFILEAARGGQIPGEQAEQALKIINPEMAAQLPKGVIGPSVETQQALQSRAALDKIAAGLGLEPGTPEAVIREKLSAQTPKQYAPPEIEKLLSAREAAQAAGDNARVQALDARIQKLTHIAPQSSQQQGGFGSGMLGQAYEVIEQVERLRQSGQPIPQDLAIRFRIAQHILQQPQLRAGPGGEMMTYTPGLPQFGSTEPARASPPKGTLETIRTAESDGSAEQALSALNDVASILNDAAQSGETVTGVVGTAKRLGGGLARQAGVPVSPQAERLSRALERLKAIVGPSILKDSRLSDQERKRVEQIVGNVDPFTDEVALRESLSDLAAILGRLQGGKNAPQGGQQQEQRRVVVDW